MILIPLLCFAQLNAQQVITGKVVDESNSALPGVSIQVKGTTHGTFSDMNGNFTINAGQTDTLLFSMIGMTTQKVAVGTKATFNIKLLTETTSIGEVVVVGYGTQKVKDLTSSISTIKADEISKVPSGNAMQGLQGKIAGLQIVSSGSPGVGPTIHVRGVGSYSVLKNSDDQFLHPEAPLYVVDGMFFDNIDFLNPSDIVSLSVLKDASAAAIYGVRAANGVILIETRSGSTNQKAQVTYSGYYGVQIAQNVLKMANAEQFTTMAMESHSAADSMYVLNAMQRYGRSRVNPNLPNVNTDWYKEVLRPARIQNHSFDVSGGSEKATYSLGASYFTQEGIMNMKNDYTRFNLRSKIDYQVKNWLKIGGNLLLGNSVQYKPADAAWNLAYFAVPIIPVIDETKTDATPPPYRYANAHDIGYRNGQNPFPSMVFTQDRDTRTEVNGNFYAEFQLIPKKLVFKTTYSQSYTSSEERKAELPYNFGLTLRTNSDVSKLTRWSRIYDNRLFDNVLTYNDNFGKHNLVVMAGTSYRDESYLMFKAAAEAFPVANEQTWYFHQGSTTNTYNDTGDDGTRYYGLSYFGRFSYNYNGKYLAYATMRADGSSKYQQKWGYFPAFGVGWVISEESFLKDNTSINFLKLRASWGRLGNDKIPASDGGNTITPNYAAINNVRTTGSIITNTFSWLKWEVTEETNFGITSKILNDRLSLDADYYIRDTKNAAMRIFTAVTGTEVTKPVGVIRNKGLEITINWNDKLGNDFLYSIGGNIATLKNEVKDLYGVPYVPYATLQEFPMRSYVGQPMLGFYGYTVAGVYQTATEIQGDAVAQATMAAQGVVLVPGDLKFKDLNGDGVINALDRSIIGSYMPKFTYGFNFAVSYKNFDISANVMGQSGNKIFNRKRGEVIWTNDQNMDADLAINRWHGAGTSNKYPSSAGLRKAWNQKLSNFFVEDGSFFRIQNVQLAYNIRGKKLFGFDFPETRISLTADRPLTIFKYNGFSPEVADGIDDQTYPVPAVYALGLNIKF